MVEGWQIKCYVNHLILKNNYDIVFAGKIPLVDDKQYQVCTRANDLLIEYEKKKAEEEEKENGGSKEENNPCWHSARLAAKRGIRDLNNVRLLEVPCSEDKVEERNAFASLMLQEESNELEELLENDSDGVDELDEEVEVDEEVEAVEEEDEDAMEVVENAQKTDGIQNKEGNKDGRNEVSMDATDGKQNEGSDKERNNKTTDDGKKTKNKRS